MNATEKKKYISEKLKKYQAYEGKSSHPKAKAIRVQLRKVGYKLSEHNN